MQIPTVHTISLVRDITEDYKSNNHQFDGIELHQYYVINHADNIDLHNKHPSKLFRHFCDANVAVNLS